MDTSSPLAPLVGRWQVRRESGLLPDFGLSKSIAPDGRGVTRVVGLPLLPFRIRALPDGGAELRYRLLPLADTLVRDGETYLGRGLLFGHEFCRFRLVARR